MKELMLKNGKYIVLREAQSTDAGDILEYVEKISTESDFLTFGPGEFNIGLEKERGFLDCIFKCENSIYLLALLDNQIIGSLNFSAGQRPRTAHTGEMGVSVLKEFWGIGTGTALIGFLLQWARKTNIIKKINLRVRVDNKSGIFLYEKMGFKQEGKISRDFLINGIFYDSYVMGYEID